VAKIWCHETCSMQCGFFTISSCLIGTQPILIYIFSLPLTSQRT